jgi:hypothetical protein
MEETTEAIQGSGSAVRKVPAGSRRGQEHARRDLQDARRRSHGDDCCHAFYQRAVGGVGQARKSRCGAGPHVAVRPAVLPGSRKSVTKRNAVFRASDCVTCLRT